MITENNESPTCPHCGKYPMKNWWITIPKSSGFINCYHCDKLIRVDLEIQYKFTLTKSKEYKS